MKLKDIPVPSHLRKLGILLWKNALLKRRHWIQTLAEIFVPTLLFLGLLSIFLAGGDNLTPTQQEAVVNRTETWPVQYCSSLFQHTYNGTLANRTLAYTNRPGETAVGAVPESKLVKDIMRKIQQTVDHFVMPFCQIGTSVIGNFTNVTIDFEEQGQLFIEERGNEQLIIEESNQYQNSKDSWNGEFYGGIIFEPDFDYIGGGRWPDEGPKPAPPLRYTIRLGPDFAMLQTEVMYPSMQLPGPGYAGAKYEDFVKFQNLVDLAYTEIITGTKFLPQSLEEFEELLFVPAQQQMPYPPYLENYLSIFLGYLLPVFCVLSFCFILPPLVKRVVHEKETGVKELMRLMGMPNWLYWLSWFLTAFVTTAITCAIIIMLICIEWKNGIGGVIAFSNPAIVYIFFLLYGVSLIVFLFALSTFFESPNIALCVAVVLHILMFIVPSEYIDEDEYWNMSLGVKLLLSLMPNVGLLFGIHMISVQEGKGSGVQWYNLDEQATPEDKLTMGLMLGMLFLDSVIFAIVTWYVDAVKPGKFGVARKLYFPFQISYWFEGSSFCSHQNHEANLNAELHDMQENKEGGANNPEMFETEPEGEHVGILALKLRKHFKSMTGGVTKAVNDVSFAAYRGQITALLGHNGAGKTTTMSVLTGMYSPSSGAAFINGFDIRTEMARARKTLGLCPQHNMLFTDLNVREHYIFFAMLKGLSRKDALYEADEYIRLLNMDDKRDVLVSKLSGGMKRKVNLGIALIGGSEVVMLDEPTSGMDPEARRGMWDLLQMLKKERTILLTTHFMEEADVLGDRIAIMSRGRVHCSGSPLFLKTKFGNGYSLNMTRGEGCNPAQITELVSEHVDGARLRSEASGELIFALPNDQVAKFSALFERLEKTKVEMNVISFGLSVTTMEDVFLKVGHLAEESLDKSKYVTLTSREETTNDLNGPTIQTPHSREEDDIIQKFSSPGDDFTEALVRTRLTGFALWRARMMALLKKRIIYTKRRYVLFIVMSIVPFVLCLICQWVVNAVSDPTYNFGSRLFELSDYEDAVSFVDSSDDFVSRKMAEIYRHLIEGSSGISEVEEGSNITATILAYGERNLADYRTKAIVSADFHPHRMTALYNSVPNHARPISVNLMSNTLLRYLEQPNIEPPEGPLLYHDITTISWPLPLQKVWRTDILDNAGTTYLVSASVIAYGLAIPTGVGILVAAFLIFPLTERVTNAKQVQLMSGVRHGTYWLSNLIWDLTLFFASLSLMLAVLFLLDKTNTFTTNGAGGALFLILFMAGLSSIPMSYVFSFATKTAASGFALMIILNILTGAIASLGVFILRFFGGLNGVSGLIVASDVIRYSMVFFPAFPLSRSIMGLVQIQQENMLCETGLDPETLGPMCEMFLLRPEVLYVDGNQGYAQCCSIDYVNSSLAICGTNITVGALEEPIQVAPCHKVHTMFNWDQMSGINIDLLTMTGDMLLYFFLLFFIETGMMARLQTKMRNRGKSYLRTELSEMDEDVRAEAERILGAEDNHNIKEVEVTQQEDVLQVHDLAKNFGDFTAVRGLNFGIRHGECFGLLGINGAGKTTTFRMLTGDEVRTAGDGIINGARLSGTGKERRQFLRQIGYCPQFDSIIDVLTGREMLVLFARIRGIPEPEVKAEVEKWIKFLEIEIYADKQCGTYSGGNKRKLNVAQALIGDPPIVFMDEPSTGVDPVARRKLWNIISSVQANGQSVVLTSHSMEECEALCDRLGIMVNGQFQCLGGTQHLKSKFGQGFTILVKLNTRDKEPEAAAADMDSVVGRIQEAFRDCSVKDQHRDYVHLHVSNPNLPWHYLFSSMEQLKSDFPVIEDYSVSETTLEQVFLSFAKHQKSHAPEEGQQIQATTEEEMEEIQEKYGSTESIAESIL